MDSPYQDTHSALKYLEFLNSVNGRVQQKVLLDAILARLPGNKHAAILDAACGSGWLAGELKNNFSAVEACDASGLLLQFAKVNYPGINFKAADLNRPLPYSGEIFDFVILNMAAPDLSDLPEAFKNLSSALKPGGRLIATIPNPKYTYPAAEWKRGATGFLLGQKPRLEMKTPPEGGTKIQREFGKNSGIGSFYYTMANYLAAGQSAGLKLAQQDEITSPDDSPNFDLTYQLYRYPLLLLLEFVK